VTATRCTTADHTAALQSDPIWRTWHPAGTQHIDADETGPAVSLELRSCPHCLSTLSKEITP
jgi:hypothetical protein